MTYFVGLDVSLEETAICVVDNAGEILREGKAETEPEAISSWLKAVDVAIERLGLEAGPLSPWLSQSLQVAGLPAVCIETRRMKGATAAMAVKTDRNDARAIAQAIRVGWFTAVHVKSAESQELRLLLTNRKTLLTGRVMLENEIRGTLKAFGLKVGRVPVATFEARVIELTADQPRLQAMVRPMLAARLALRLQFEALHVMVLKAVKSHAVCRRLLTVPGVGAVTALTFATAIDDPALCSIARCRSTSGLDAAQIRLGRDRPQWCDQQEWRPAGAGSAVLGSALPADPCYPVVGAESLGHGDRQAPRLAPRDRGGCAQARGDHAPHVGGRQ